MARPIRLDERRHREADDQRHAGAVDGAREDIAAELVGAEPEALRRRAQPVDGRLPERIAGDQGAASVMATRATSSTAPMKIVGLRRMAVAARASGEATCGMSSAVATRVTGLST